MGMRINTNVEAFNAQRNLSLTATTFAKSVEKLSSGMRINRAGDDAAGLSISEKLRAQIRGLGQASRNAQDGISMIQTAEGALGEVHSMLQRMRELAVQASNDTLSDSDRAAVNSELQQLSSEIDAISLRTKFNGKNLLNGTLASAVNTSSEVKVGTVLASGATSTNVAVTTLDVSGAVGSSTGLSTYTFTYSSASDTLTLTDSACSSRNQAISVAATAAGGTQTLNFSNLGIKLTVTNSTGTSKTADELGYDLALAASDTIILATGSGAANFQIGTSASSNDSLSVSFSLVDTSASSLNIAAALSTFNTTQSVDNAKGLITAVDTAIDSVSTTRSGLGARQNRLEHTIANLGVAQENLTASESRIRDVDMAAEMVNFTKTQILQQAGTAILAQANQAPQGVLQLLR